MTSTPPRPRPPISVIVAGILVLISGILDIVGGIVTILTRYAPEVAANRGDQFTVTLLGAGAILIGLFTCALASGLFRGRRSARLIVTIALGLSFAIALVDLIVDPTDLVSQIADPVVTALIALALWLGPARRHFAGP